jgi:signal transduction histidine kinase
MRPRRTVRVRLAAWYAATFLLCGGTLLGIAYVVVSRSIGAYERQVDATVARELRALSDRQVAAGMPPIPLEPESRPSREERAIRRAAEASARSEQRQRIAGRFAAALAALTLLSVGVGWLAAGRALRPVARIAAAARRVAGGRLDERVALDGPRDELRELADTFDAMLARLDAAFAAQQRFVANASHELRTPLAVMRGELEATLGDPDAGEAQLRQMAGVIAEAVDRVDRLIAGLLVLARSERALSRRHPADLGELAEASLDPLREEIEGMRLQLVLDLRPAPVLGDPALLERLAANLLENAVRYNRPRGELRVISGRSGAVSMLEVVNDGIVVMGEDAPALFEPFRRLEPSRSRATGGAGLGLSIVNAVARLHEGLAEAVPRESGGLVVGVRLPAAATSRQGAAPTAGDLASSARG